MDLREFPVIYLTGAPASGKSSASKKLLEMVPSLHLFNYGEELVKYLIRKNGGELTQDILREKSANIANQSDIQALDLELIDIVSKERTQKPILIDTHAVTKESYGFRVTPFSMDLVKRLNPTRIVVLYTSPEIAIHRIATAPGGRPQITEFESTMHTGLQASVAISYAIGLGLPVHFLDSAVELESIARWLSTRI